MRHVATVRPGRGWNEARATGLPVESNFVVECSCGYVMQCCTLREASARQTAAQHIDHAAWKED